MGIQRTIVVGIFGGALAFVAALSLSACGYLSGTNTSCPAVQEISDPSTVALPEGPKPAPKDEIDPASVVVATPPTATAEPAAPPVPDVVDAGAVAHADAGAKKPPTAATAVAVAVPAAACGDKANPCPMQKFMRTTMVGAGSSPDALAAAFARVAGASPNGGWQWRAIAQKGADSAKSGDTAEAKKQCKACHEQYRDQYKQQYRARKF